MTRLAICASILIACGGGDSVPADECGDGVIDPGEECDDGNAARGDGCFECVVEPPVCGNGVLDFNEDCDDSNVIDGDGCSAICEQEIPERHIQASWAFKDLQGDVTTGCPVGFASMRLTTVLVGGTDEVTDTFDCAAGSGTSSLVAPGRYTVTLTAFDMTTAAEYGSSLPEEVDAAFGDAPYAATIFNDAGYLSFGWSLRGAISLMNFTCAQSGAMNVRATFTGPTAIAPVFPCADLSAITVPLLAGSYSITFQALGNGGQSMGTFVNPTAVTINGANEITVLAPVIIPLDGF